MIMNASTRQAVAVSCWLIVTVGIHGHAFSQTAVELFSAYEANWKAVKSYDCLTLQGILMDDAREPHAANMTIRKRVALHDDNRGVASATHTEIMHHLKEKGDEPTKPEGERRKFGIMAIAGQKGLYNMRKFPEPTVVEDVPFSEIASAFQIFDHSFIGLNTFPVYGVEETKNQNLRLKLMTTIGNAKVASQGRKAIISFEDEKYGTKVEILWEFDLERYVPTKHEQYVTPKNGKRRRFLREQIAWEERNEIQVPVSMEMTYSSSNRKIITFVTLEWIAVNDNAISGAKNPHETILTSLDMDITSSEANAIQFIEDAVKVVSKKPNKQ